MEYYINPMWFYCLHVVNSIRDFLVLGAVISAITLLICGVAIIMCLDCIKNFQNVFDGELKALPKWRKLVLPSAVTCGVCMLLLVFIPSKETMIEMMIARQVTPQNVEAGVEAIKGAVDYVIQAIQNAK